MQHDLLAALSPSWVEQLHRPVTGQTICFILGQRRCCARPAKAIYPAGRFTSVNPQMSPFITLVRQIPPEPFTNDSIRNAEVFGEFGRPIQHRQQAGRAHDDRVRQSQWPGSDGRCIDSRRTVLRVILTLVGGCERDGQGQAFSTFPNQLFTSG